MSSESTTRLLLAVNDGVTTRRALLAAGVARSWIVRRVRAGDLVEFLPGVLIEPCRPSTFRQRLRAALAFAGRDSAVSHDTALLLWGLARRPASGDVHVCVPNGRVVRSTGFVVVHQRTSREAIERDGLRVVPPREALVQLAAASSDRFRFTAFDALDRGLLTVPELADPFGVPRAASRNWRLVAEETAAGARSGGEARYWRLLKDARVPLPVLNARVDTDLGPCFVDALWRDHSFGVEIDGRAVHTQAEAFDADRRRQNALYRAGIVLIRFTVQQVMTQGDDVVKQTRAPLAVRASERR